jgi:aspartate-semialdehyde dehydrogenase
MTAGVNVAIVGATGAVGEAMREILEQRRFPVETLSLLASERSAGKRLQFRGKSVMVQRLDEFDFAGTQIGLFSAGADLSAEFAPKAAAAGCLVIDNTSQFRYEADIPLVVPEVNAEVLDSPNPRNIIANPNCSTIQLLVALKPIHDAARIRRVNVATYQAVSGAGTRGIKELAAQTANLLNAKPIELDVMPKQIAFNAIPRIDAFQANGYTREEMKLVWETQKILGDESIQVNPTCVRIPVFFGHSEVVNIETERKVSADEVRVLLAQAPGVKVIDDPEGDRFPTAVGDAAGTDDVFVGRIREDISHPNGINLWVVSDNVRKGAALNSVQIAERVIERWDQAAGPRH